MRDVVKLAFPNIGDESRFNMRSATSRYVDVLPSRETEPPSAAVTRHFVYVAGKSSKFWEISRSGCDVTVRYGRTGSAGQSKQKSFTDETAATRHAEKLIAEKTGEGYVEYATSS